MEYGDAMERLTGKQEAFAQAVARGMTLHDAYRASYDAAKMGTPTVYQAASKLMDNEFIQARVKELVETRTDRSLMADRQRVRQYVFDRLMLESKNEESPPAARIKALELLGKVRGVDMFGEGKQEEGRKAAADIEADIRRRLADLLGASTGT